ncbi:MAG TPA: serine hydrolase [Candidatus Limnocylindria bacterium]
MKGRSRAAFAVVALGLLVAAGSIALLSRAALPVVAPSPRPNALSWQALRNATYPASLNARGVQLRDGIFDQPAAPGSASRIIVRLADLAAFGNLDADDQIDAAVILVSSGGGTGTFVDVAAVLNDAGTARPVANALLGDRVLVREVGIENGTIVVRLRVRGATDPFTLRTTEITRRYALDAGRLVLRDESQSQVQTPPADNFVYQPQRLDVPPGSTRHIDGTLAPGQIAPFVVHGRAGETLALTVRSEFDNAVLSVAGLTDTTTLVSRQDYAVDRSIVLGSEQDYAVKVVTLAGQPLAFGLDVSLRAAAQASASPARPAPLPLPSRTPPSVASGAPGIAERPLRDASGSAASYAASRQPVWGVAVYVPSQGIVYTENADTQVPTASVVKVLVMLVVLEQARAEGRPVSEDELALLWPMITESDNDATTQLWERIGRGQALASYLRSIGVSGVTPDPATSWGVSFASARAMATVLGKLQGGEILDAASRVLAVRLMDSVVSAQRWGVTAGTDVTGGDRVAIKNGWYPGDEGWRVNSVGIVRPASGAPYTIAVMTDERVSFEEGVETIEGIALRVNNELRGSRG